MSGVSVERIGCLAEEFVVQLESFIPISVSLLALVMLRRVL